MRRLREIRHFPGAELGTVQECPECGGYLDVPEFTRVPTVYEQQTDSYARQSEENERQLRESAKQQEQSQRQLDRGDRLAAIEENLLDRASRLLERWETLTVRVEGAINELEKRSRLGA